jgi:hypothetical protein
MIGVIGTRMECRAENLRAGPSGAKFKLADVSSPQIGADRPLLVEAFRCVSSHRSRYGVGGGLLFPGSCFHRLAAAELTAAEESSEPAAGHLPCLFYTFFALSPLNVHWLLKKAPK